MPRVLRIINRFNLGGPTYNASYLTRYMSNKYQTRLVGGLKEDDEESSEYIVRNLGIEPEIIPEMRRAISLKNDWVAFRKICRIIREFNPDVVHTHASKAGTIGRLAAAWCRVPVVVHTFHGHVFHSYFGKAKTAMYLTIERFLAHFTTRIIAISEKQRHELADVFQIAQSKKFTVVPLGFDLTRFTIDKEQRRTEFRKRYNVTDNQVAVGIVGRLAHVKNHAFFIDVIATLKNQSKVPVRAFIVGDGSLRNELVQQCENKGLTVSQPEKENLDADVVFTSWIKNVETVYPAFDILAMTSLNEGTPVSIIEAQAAGVPVVSTNVGGIEDIVENGKTALLVENGNLDEFVRSLRQMVENQEFLAEMSNSGVEHVMKKYHYTRLVSDVEKLYDELLTQKVSSNKG